MAQSAVSVLKWAIIQEILSPRQAVWSTTAPLPVELVVMVAAAGPERSGLPVRPARPRPKVPQVPMAQTESTASTEPRQDLPARMALTEPTALREEMASQV